jgi:hypothetical protein
VIFESAFQPFQTYIYHFYFRAMRSIPGESIEGSGARVQSNLSSHAKKTNLHFDLARHRTKALVDSSELSHGRCASFRRILDTQAF